MNRSDYKWEMFEFITANGDVRTNKFCAEARKCISESEYVIEDPCRKKFIKIMNPLLPRLHELPKIHKVDIPLRPVVTYISTSSYYVSTLISRSRITQFFVLPTP